MSQLQWVLYFEECDRYRIVVNECKMLSRVWGNGQLLKQKLLPNSRESCEGHSSIRTNPKYSSGLFLGTHQAPARRTIIEDQIDCVITHDELSMHHECMHV